MSPSGSGSLLTPDSTLAILGRDLHVRVLNCSASGCLVETTSRLEVGTIATLTVTIHGDEFADDVQVVRCQPIEGTGGLFHVGAQFIWMANPRPRSLRQVIRRSAVFALNIEHPLSPI